jgi:flagellin
LLVASTSAVSNVNNAKSKLGASLEKLSTGSRINSASDDSAGLNMAGFNSTESRSLRVAINNINDGVSLLQTADGGLDVMYDILIRMRELAVQSGNEIYNDNERALIDMEWDELVDGFQQISGKTSFNSKSLLESTSTITLQVGIYNSTGNKININLSDINASSGTNGLNLQATFDAGIDDRETALTTLSALDQGMDDISARRSVVGGYINRLENTLNEATSHRESKTMAASRISDADYAVETSVMTRNQVMFNASTAALGQLSSMRSSSISLIGS